MMQNTYQKQRYYTLGSLGKVSNMDVAANETLAEAQVLTYMLVFLLLLLTAAYSAQLWLAYKYVNLLYNLHSMPAHVHSCGRCTAAFVRVYRLS